MRLFLFLLLVLLLAACRPTAQVAPTPAAPVATAFIAAATPTSAPSLAPTALAATPRVGVPAASDAGWTRYTTANGLPSDDLLTVAVAQRGTDQGTCEPTPGAWEGSVWVGTAGAGLAYGGPGGWTTINRANSGGALLSDTVQAIAFAPGLRVFIGGRAGLNTYCPFLASETWQLRSFPWNPPATSTQALVSVGSAHWAGNPDGARTMYHGQIQRFAAPDVLALAGSQSSSRVWAGTWGGGVTVYLGSARVWDVQQTFTTANSGLASDRVTALAYVPRPTPSQTGVLWIGHSPDPAAGRPGGVSRYDDDAPPDSRWQTFSVASGALPSDEVHAVAVDRAGDVWVGTDAGLARRDARTGAWTVYTVETTAGGLGANVVSGIAVAADGTRWFATRGGGLSRLVGAPPAPATATPGPPAPTATTTPTPRSERLFLPHIRKG